MGHLVIVILDDLRVLPDLLKVWQAIGAGATILESTGAHRTTHWLSRVGLNALDRLFEAREIRRRTLLTAVDSDELLERVVAEAERVIGGFDRPDSGLLLVLPLTQIRGLRKATPKPVEETLPPAVQPDWIVRRDTPIADVMAILSLEPTIVRSDTPLNEVTEAMMARPNVRVACVVDDEERLIGLLQLRALADDLFFRIMPEEFLIESFDLQHVLQFADKSRMRTAADAMQKAVWVKQNETVKEAFKRMHEHQLPGLPVVNQSYQVIGYINLLELLAACAQQAKAPAVKGESAS